jgi:cardiolipin synthase
VFTNGPRVEQPILYHAQRSFYRRLIDTGIEVYESVDVYNHAKLIVVDGKTVIVGSANVDLRSAHLNFEIAAVVVEAHELAAQVLQTIEKRGPGFRRIRVEDLPLRGPRRVLDSLCGLFAPLL